MNLIGLDAAAVGNHEFDEGAEELRRIQEGGCHPIDGCLDGDGFAGADFAFLADNVIDTRDREAVLRALRADIDLVISKRAHDVISATADNVVVTRDVDPAPDLTALIERYGEIAQPLANRVIGSAGAPITRDQTPAGESALGDLIADAQLAATDDPSLGGAQIIFMNPGGIRADLDAGDITYGEAFTVQPFGNNLVTLTLTGAQIETLLEQQFCNPTADDPASRRVLQVSEGFSYTWSASAPCGDKLDPATITLNGSVLDPSAGYRVTVNSFLADGGDSFAVLTEAPAASVVRSTSTPWRPTPPRSSWRPCPRP